MLITPPNRLPFTADVRLTDRWHRRDGRRYFARATIDVDTRDGCRSFEWNGSLASPLDVWSWLDRHVQCRARAMGWRPA